MRILALLDHLRDWVALALSLVLALATMSASNHPSAANLRHALRKPLEWMASPVSGAIRATGLWTENADLRAEVLRLSMQQQQWRDARLENARLRKLLGFRDRPEFDYLAAEVIARDPSPTLSSLVLDKGTEDSVRIGQAVVTAEGLAGMVHHAGPTTSTVLLAVDRNFAVSARVERSRVDGMIRWAGGTDLQLTDVPRNLDVREGDRIVTSGLGGMVSSGIPVGLVVNVNREDPLFLDVAVKPFVSYHTLEEVFVLIPRAGAVQDSATIAVQSADTLEAGR